MTAAFATGALARWKAGVSKRVPQKLCWGAGLIALGSLGCALPSAVEQPVGEPKVENERTAAPGTPSRPGVLPTRVVVVSIAGLAPEHYGAGRPGRGLSRHGTPMSALAARAAAGTYTDGMRPVLPAAPYPVHGTLVTGRVPARHGVLGALIMTREGLSQKGMGNAARLEGPTLWHAARAAGIGVTALGWPSTLGAQIDLLLPDVGLPTGAEKWYDVMKGRATPWIYERLGLFDEALPEVVWPQPSVLDSLVTKVACEIAAQPRTPGLWLLHYGQGATALALHGPGTEAGLDGMRRVDALVEELLGCFEDAGLIGSTAFLFTGDRSLQPVHSIAAPNVALEAAGLLSKGQRHLGIASRKWSAIVRSYGGSAMVYAEDERSARLARTALERQAAETAAYRVVSAAELVELSADPQAWFGLEAYPGYVLSNDVSGASVAATELRGAGGYLPGGRASRVGFVAWGAGVRGGVRVPLMRQLDVAPTAADLLGVSLAGADGRPLVGLLGRTPLGREGIER